MTADYECCASGSCEVCRRPSGYSREQREQKHERTHRTHQPRDHEQFTVSDVHTPSLSTRPEGRTITTGRLSFRA